ncbi:thioredoxin-like protein [Pilatotrama ljubarskyi]|nr:thioredoxin-like protein [Pilatotrama ljubarskyi]
MAPSEQMTFYTADDSPYPQRAGAKYTAYQLNQRGARPEWYYRINPFGKVPALTFGGPDVPYDQPSPESKKVIESMAILEFLADIFPEAKLLPTDPILRAKARTFVEIYRNYVADEFREAFFLGKPVEGILQALQKLQNALPPTGFAAGEWSIADAAVAPFVTRLELFLRTRLGAYSEEDWKKLLEALDSDKFSRITHYIRDIREGPSFKKSWGDDVSHLFGQRVEHITDIPVR